MKKQINHNIATQAHPINNSKFRIENLLALILGDKWKSPKFIVNVLLLQGLIGKAGFKTGLNLNSINEEIERAFATKKLSAVCLIINSPGGSPVQSEFIASRIINLSREKKIPVYSFVEDVAASGGYWLACAGDKIFASKSSIIGSIGVVSSGFGFQEAINKLGIERRVYTQGDNKSVLDPFQPAKAHDIKIIKNLQKDIHEHFIDYVKDRRRNKLTQADEILFNGEFWTGQIAVDFGLIDGIDDFFSFIDQKFGKNVKIEYIQTKQSWLKRKMGMTFNNISEIFAHKIVDTVISKVNSSKYDLS